MNSEIEKKYWARVEKYIGILQIVPFVRMIAVCNNLAFGKVDKNSDIDLFIISKKGRLFVVRIIVTFLLHIFGVRRYGKNVKGRFCLSYFIDETAMDLSKIAIENDIYLAFWIKSMKPIIDDGVSEEFLRRNAWCKRYFEEDFNISNEKNIEKGKIKDVIRMIFEWALGGWLGDYAERKLGKWQKNRAKNKAGDLKNGESNIIISDSVLKFHNIDRRRMYRNEWIKRKKSMGKINDEEFMEIIV